MIFISAFANTQKFDWFGDLTSLVISLQAEFIFVTGLPIMIIEKRIVYRSEFIFSDDKLLSFFRIEIEKVKHILNAVN